MGLFSKSSNKPQNPVQELMAKIFPNGQSDMISGAYELLEILNHSIPRANAHNIFVKSMSICYMTENFDLQRLKDHLDGYCKGVFDSEEMMKFHVYLLLRKTALIMNRQVIKDEKGSYSLKSNI